MNRYSLPSVNLRYILIVLHSLCSTNSSFTDVVEKTSYLFKSSNIDTYYVFLINRSLHQSSFLRRIYLTQYFTNLISEKHLQTISLVLLLDSNDSYLAYCNYLQKYRLLFRRCFTKNMIGYQYYDNNQYINKLALINLRAILLSSQLYGVYFLWLYLVYYNPYKL